MLFCPLVCLMDPPNSSLAPPHASWRLNGGSLELPCISAAPPFCLSYTYPHPLAKTGSQSPIQLVIEPKLSVLNCSCSSPTPFLYFPHCFLSFPAPPHWGAPNGSLHLQFGTVMHSQERLMHAACQIVHYEECHMAYVAKCGVVKG